MKHVLNALFAGMLLPFTPFMIAWQAWQLHKSGKVMADAKKREAAEISDLQAMQDEARQ